MSSNNQPACHGALQSGLLVKDRLGVRKRVIRVEDEVVYREYVNPPADARPGEHSTSYDDFVDSHFVLPPAS